MKNDTGGNEKYGFIDTTGAVALPLEYDGAGTVYEYDSEGDAQPGRYCWVRKGASYGIFTNPYYTPVKGTSGGGFPVVPVVIAVAAAAIVVIVVVVVVVMKKKKSAPAEDQAQPSAGTGSTTQPGQTQGPGQVPWTEQAQQPVRTEQAPWPGQAQAQPPQVSQMPVTERAPLFGETGSTSQPGQSQTPQPQGSDRVSWPQQPQAIRFCPQCGAMMTPDIVQCPRCGKQFED